MNAIDSLYFIRSEIFLFGALLAVLIFDFFVQEKKWLGILAFISIVIAFLISPNTFPNTGLFFNYFVLDPFTFFFKSVAYLTIALTILSSLVYKNISEKFKGELYVLLLAMGPLLTIMSGVTNLLMIFIAIESVSLTSYLLVGFQTFDKRSSEASLKYVLFGAVSTALMLFGMSLLFGSTGTIELSKIGLYLSHAPAFQSIILLGMIFLLIGVGFKISMVPFHMWAPDVYQGAPTPVAAFLTVAPKALGFAVLARILYVAFPFFVSKWSHLLSILAILTMTFGNVIAISQTDVKRLLAYSSIAQAGYILVGFATPGLFGLQAVLIYITAYLFTNLGAFFTVLAIERNLETNQIDSYNGLSERAPLLALSLTIFLLSLAGIPPLAGFIGKIYIFSAAVKTHSIALALAIAINSAMAAYYYFKIVKAMYLSKAQNTERFTNPLPIKIVVTAALLGTFLIGLFPVHFIKIVEQSLAGFAIF